MKSSAPDFLLREYDDRISLAAIDAAQVTNAVMAQLQRAQHNFKMKKAQAIYHKGDPMNEEYDPWTELKEFEQMLESVEREGMDRIAEFRARVTQLVRERECLERQSRNFRDLGGSGQN